MKYKRIPVLKLHTNHPSFLPGNLQKDLPVSYSVLTKRRLLGIVNDVAIPAESHRQEMDFYNINTFEMFMTGVWLT